MSITTIEKPSVYLVGRQEIDREALSRFLGDEGVERWATDTEVAGQELVEVAGRLCYKSFAAPRPGGNKAYTDHILDVGHGSVLEHAVFNFILTGVSRSFTHELVRHRAGFGYSQLSQRFVDEAGCSFVVPSDYREEVAVAKAFMEEYGHREAFGALYSIRTNRGEVQPNPRFFPGEAVEMGLVWLYAMETAQHCYGRLSEYGMKKNAAIPDKTLRRKRAREAARSVLPNATETQIFVTGNARALRHFVEMRGDIAADREIRGVALAMLEILQVEAPNLFGDYHLDTINGEHAISTPNPKV